MWKRSCWVCKLFCLLLVAALCCGCSGQKEAAATDITFTDSLGRQVSVSAGPQRVAALLGSFADLWLLAGGSICAAPEEAWEDFQLALPEAVNLGDAHSVSLEKLFAAEPDFVIASASTAGNVQLQPVLEQAGIPVAYFDVDGFADYLAMLDICTDITGRKDLYETNGLALEAQIQAVKEAVKQADIPAEQNRVLLLRVSSGSIKTKGSAGTVLGEMLADLGCQNIADSDRTLLENLSVESVIRQAPYRIFVVTMGNDTQKATENLTRMIEENPAWGSLEAVQAGRLHIMDRTRFNIKPNAKWAEAYEELGSILLEK